MDLTEEVSKRKELCGIIEDLSKEKNEESLNSLCSKLQNLYCDGSGKKFRHFYSDISSVLRAVHEDNKGGLDAIVTNLEKIKNMLSERDGNFYETLNKLIDHVCLESLRIKFSEKTAEGVCSNKEELKRSSERLLEELRRNYDDLNQKTGNLEEKFKDKTDGIQKQFVAVLGIFASIITVCSGGLSFTNAALSSILNANVFKLIAVSLTVGLVLIDVCLDFFTASIIS